MASDLRVGDVVALRVPCLQNEPGALGVVFNEYELNGHGVQIIFENGEYDGFSETDQEEWLNYIGHNEITEGYRFTNVMKLSDDYRRGIFESAFLSE